MPAASPAPAAPTGHPDPGEEARLGTEFHHILTPPESPRWPDRIRRAGRGETPTDPAETLCGTGRLVAVIAYPGQPDHRHAIVISRPGVRFANTERAPDEWRSWAMIAPRCPSRARHAYLAGLSMRRIADLSARMLPLDPNRFAGLVRSSGSAATPPAPRRAAR